MCVIIASCCDLCLFPGWYHHQPVSCWGATVLLQQTLPEVTIINLYLHVQGYILQQPMSCKPKSVFNALAVEHIPAPINHTVKE